MRWMWIDQIVEHVPGRRLCAIKNVSLSEEHLHDHSVGSIGPVMPASLMIEGMAQTAGILVGSINRFKEKVVLAKIALARFDAEVLPGQTIRYEAEIERIDPQGASTRGIIKRLSHTGGHTEPPLQWEAIGEIELMFSHLDQNMAGLEFPEENFVFSENFRMILDAAGMGEYAR